MATPTLEQIKRALHIGEQIEKLQAEMASIFGEKIPQAVQSVGTKVATLIRGKKRKPRFSKAAREAISAAQKKRWAKVKGGTAKPAAKVEKPRAKKKKGKMSAAGRANIVAAQKARWAKIKSEKAKAKA